MDNFDAYAPPRAAVLDIDAEGTPAKIPLLFKILLIAYVALHVLGTCMALSVAGVVWAGVIAIASWRTLAGSRAASRVLGVVMVIALVFALFAAVMVSRASPGWMAAMLAQAAYLAVLVGYLYFHPAMQAVLRQSDAKKWRGA